ncbi:replicase protein [Rosa rugosa leaf distortion virus]|nr:replicase protein [Rosa rugosa leaf distortion virus]AGF70698.1 replicase protein [Rosa rugosa leaf distortion virus]
MSLFFELAYLTAKAGFVVAKELALLATQIRNDEIVHIDVQTDRVRRVFGIQGREIIPTSDCTDLLNATQDLVVADPDLHEEECLEDIKEEVKGDGGEVSQKVVRRRVRKKLPFACILAADAKNHFGGVPSACRANELSVTKYLVSKCKERKLTVLQTRQVSSLAFCLVFTPDSNDKSIYQFLNSESVFERRCDYLKSQSVESCWMQLFSSPWNPKAWRRVILRLSSLGPQEAFRFVK